MWFDIDLYIVSLVGLKNKVFLGIFNTWDSKIRKIFLILYTVYLFLGKEISFHVKKPYTENSSNNGLHFLEHTINWNDSANFWRMFSKKKMSSLSIYLVLYLSANISTLTQWNVPANYFKICYTLCISRPYKNSAIYIYL